MKLRCVGISLVLLSLACGSSPNEIDPTNTGLIPPERVASVVNKCTSVCSQYEICRGRPDEALECAEECWEMTPKPYRESAVAALLDCMAREVAAGRCDNKADDRCAAYVAVTSRTAVDDAYTRACVVAQARCNSGTNYADYFYGGCYESSMYAEGAVAQAGQCLSLECRSISTCVRSAFGRSSGSGMSPTPTCVAPNVLYNGRCYSPGWSPDAGT